VGGVSTRDLRSAGSTSSMAGSSASTSCGRGLTATAASGSCSTAAGSTRSGSRRSRSRPSRSPSTASSSSRRRRSCSAVRFAAAWWLPPTPSTASTWRRAAPLTRCGHRGRWGTRSSSPTPTRRSRARGASRSAGSSSDASRVAPGQVEVVADARRGLHLGTVVTSSIVADAHAMWAQVKPTVAPGEYDVVFARQSLSG
jgi:hypothetical protein